MEERTHENTCGTVVFHESDEDTSKRVRNLASSLILEYLLDMKNFDK